MPVWSTESIAPVQWYMALYDKNNNHLLDLTQAYDRAMHFELNGVDSCTFKVPLDFDGAGQIDPLRTNVKVWRKVDDTLFGVTYTDADALPAFAGVVGPVTMNAGSNYIEVTAYSALWKLQHRYHIDRHYFLEKDPSYIMQFLIDLTQTLASGTEADLLGIGGPGNREIAPHPQWGAYGSVANYGQNVDGEGGTVAIDYATPRGKNTWQAIEDIFTQDGMPDLTPLYVHFEGDRVTMFFNTAIVRGTRPSDVTCKFEYKTGLNNLDDMEFSVNVEPGRFATHVTAQGQGDSDAFKVIYPKVYDVEDRAILEDYGWYMKWIKFDNVKSRESLRAYARANLKRSQLPIKVYQPTLSPAVPPYFGSDFGLGDVVKLSCLRGAMVFTDEEQRIYQIDLELSEGGFERCTPTMARDFTGAVP